MKDKATFFDHVTVLILTYNEENNIERTLRALARFPRVIIVDSNSNDRTLKIAKQFPNVEVNTRVFDQHDRQWNYGLDNCGISTKWVVSLDADYVLSDSLVAEIANIDPDSLTSGYRVSFNYCIYGRKLSASLYPPHVVLFQRDRARYEQVGHTQRLVLDGDIADLAAKIDHDDRKPLGRWIASQYRYAKLEADYLLGRPVGALRPIERMRRMAIFAPVLVFFYTLIWKRCILDGWPGWLYVLQRTLAEALIALEIVDRRLSCSSEASGVVVD